MTPKKMKTKKDQLELIKRCKPLSWFKPGRKIEVDDKMQKYTYELAEKPGKNFAEGFEPELTPKQMLLLGVFEGKYLNDCVLEFPKEWWTQPVLANLSPERPDISCNYFNIKSRLSLQEWEDRGWIPIVEGDKDIRGWFQWYCRYYMGRRMKKVDEAQIKRWHAFKRHRAQVEKNCKGKCKRGKDYLDSEPCKCRPRQRQALLQWAYNPFI